MTCRARLRDVISRKTIALSVICCRTARAGSDARKQMMRRRRLKASDSRHRPFFRCRTATSCSNGLKILLVENPAIPAIALNAQRSDRVRAMSPEEKAGLAIMVSRLLDEGTKNRTSLEIAEAIESVGGAIETRRILRADCGFSSTCSRRYRSGTGTGGRSADQSDFPGRIRRKRKGDERSPRSPAPRIVRRWSRAGPSTN